MKTRMMTATAVAMLLCAPALAQTTTSGAANSSAMSSAMPQGWNEELGNAFFSDSELGTLRTEDEISTNWASLSADQRTQVSGYCDTMDTASAGSGSTMNSGGTAATGATSGSSATMASPTIPGETGTATGTTAGASGTTTGGASGGVSTDTTASTSTDGAAPATGSMDAGAGVNIASMQRLCEVVGGLN